MNTDGKSSRGLKLPGFFIRTRSDTPTSAFIYSIVWLLVGSWGAYRLFENGLELNGRSILLGVISAYFFVMAITTISKWLPRWLKKVDERNQPDDM